MVLLRALRASKIKNIILNKTLSMMMTMMIAKLIMMLIVTTVKIRTSSVMRVKKTILRIMAKKVDLVMLNRSK